MNQNSDRKKIGIIGCSGFIGSHLVEFLLENTDWMVYGVDRESRKIAHLLPHSRMDFICCDIGDLRQVESIIKKSDIVISLTALCNPALYNTIPLDVIEESFAKPLELVKLCCRYDKWLIQFSTSEVYGKTVSSLVNASRGFAPPQQYILSEDATPLIMGPIRSQRWSYAAAKQLLERTIYAYAEMYDLKYTIIRPFNFIGPRMDFIPGIDGEGIPRVFACFMEALFHNKPLKLVDGGGNRRVFTYIEDAIDAIVAIINNPALSQAEIFNVGNPDNEVSMKELALAMIKIYRQVHSSFSFNEIDASIVSVLSGDFYGVGYDDSDRRVPDISKIQKKLGWTPKTDLSAALRKTMHAFIESYYADIHCINQ